MNSVHPHLILFQYFQFLTNFLFSGARFQERIVLRHVNDIDHATGDVLYTHDTAQREDILRNTGNAKVLPSVALRRTSEPDAGKQ